MVLGSGVLIKNTMGAAGVTVLALIAFLPAAKLLTLALFYQAAGAIMQPVCDKAAAEDCFIFSASVCDRHCCYLQGSGCGLSVCLTGRHRRRGSRDKREGLWRRLF